LLIETKKLPTYEVFSFEVHNIDNKYIHIEQSMHINVGIPVTIVEENIKKNKRKYALVDRMIMLAIFISLFMRNRLDILINL